MTRGRIITFGKLAGSAFGLSVALAGSTARAELLFDAPLLPIVPHTERALDGHDALRYSQETGDESGGDPNEGPSGPTESDPGPSQNDGPPATEPISEPESPSEVSDTPAPQRVAPTTSSERPGPNATFRSERGPSIAADMDRVREACRTYAVTDRADCLRDYLKWAAKRIPQYGQYAGMRKAILKASDDIDAIVSANLDPTTPPRILKVTTPDFTSTSDSRIRRVKQARLADVNRQTAAVLDELSTTLLRSADNSSLRRADFELVAQAVDSTKVLLRSS